MANKEDLTIKQKQFVDYYLADGNATQAYKRVYGTTNDAVAASNANRLLRKEKVVDYIKQKQPELQKQVNFTVDWLRAEVYKVILDERSKPSDKLRGYEILGKTLGAFVEKIDASVKNDSQELLKQYLEGAKHGNFTKR